MLSVFRRFLELEADRRVDQLEAEEAIDPALKAEVRLLLALHEDLERSDFLEPIATVGEGAGGTPSESASIGGYRILEPIGRGGMALVYLAEQREPIWRRVAIKVLRRGIDSAEARARFQLERQALAMMDHPNVAKVFEAGTTAGGRPYFVMEYVPGLAVTHFCWKYELSLQDRLELFLQVCAAIEHAHQKGIVHRDIKPANVLVTETGEGPAARVIDFGVAKALTHKLTPGTLYTQSGQLVGTPEYMSPEQIQLDGTDVDTRTDIYSLGVLLYEMVTGVSPFAARATTSQSIDVTREAIVYQTPTLPSQTLPRTAERVEGAVSVPGRQLKGDIDWILLKSIEKDRTRRYGTVHEFSEDILHFLRDEPATAGPPSLTYRIGKFARRNKSVTLIGTVLLAIGIFLGVAFVTMLEARHRQSTESIRLYHELFEHLDNPIVVQDAEARRFEGVNQPVLDIFGYSREEFLQKAPIELSADQASSENVYDRVRLGELVHVPRRRFRRKDGSIFHAEVLTGKYVLDNREKIVGVMLRELPHHDERTDAAEPEAPR